MRSNDVKEIRVQTQNIEERMGYSSDTDSIFCWMMMSEGRLCRNY
jgi:hypothetical protein